MAAARFTPAYALLVAAWCAQVAFALGAVVARTPSWIEIAAILGVAAAAPMAPEDAVPWLVPVPLAGLAVAVLTERALWG
ncbi:hypothetical protein [Roseomonas rosulenta]|uniref:hypothetical protein n=1 Tax=Roseomonas rosulenta TaxID=2748667 RepID=UPI0018E05C49|nr:hypothetical protein [Roseomonas rosulenta]